MNFDEQQYVQELQKENIEKFLKKIKKLDDELFLQMKLKGWKYVKTAEKTVTFSFGVVRYRRRAYIKKSVWCYPVDKELGIDKYARYSQELLYQMVDYTTSMPIRHVVDKLQVTSQLYIGKSTVHSATRKISKLISEREDYRYFYEVPALLKKIKANIVYIEGDGVMVKAKDTKRGIDLAHFLVHTGSKEITPNRWKLLNKFEIVATSYTKAKEQLEDLLTNQYEITRETLLITNSDMGKGYTPYVFKELAALFKCQHEHFWDAKHLNMKIKDRMRSFPYELENQMFQSIQEHNKTKLKLVFDTTESLIESEKDLEIFLKFKKKMLLNFQYTKPARLRGLPHKGIGVMETQHRKITYRMKKRGMYWSEKGADTMSKMILAVYNNSLRDLILGSWRKDYAYYQSIDIPIGEFLKISSQSSPFEGREKKLSKKGNFYRKGLH